MDPAVFLGSFEERHDLITLEYSINLGCEKLRGTIFYTPRKINLIYYSTWGKHHAINQPGFINPGLTLYEFPLICLFAYHRSKSMGKALMLNGNVPADLPGESFLQEYSKSPHFL